MFTSNVLVALTKPFTVRHNHVDTASFAVVRFAVTIGVAVVCAVNFSDF